MNFPGLLHTSKSRKITSGSKLIYFYYMQPFLISYVKNECYILAVELEVGGLLRINTRNFVSTCSHLLGFYSTAHGMGGCFIMWRIEPSSHSNDLGYTHWAGSTRTVLVKMNADTHEVQHQNNRSRSELNSTTINLRMLVHSSTFYTWCKTGRGDEEPVWGIMTDLC